MKTKTDFRMFDDVRRSAGPESYHTPEDVDCRITANVGVIMAAALAVGGIVEAARHSPGNAAALREAPDLVITDVDERYLGDTINAWCGEGTVVVVTLSKNRGELCHET